MQNISHNFIRISTLMHILLFLIISNLVFSATAADRKFIWPTNASQTLTSVYGDMRPGRYHAGLDIRTWGLTGYQVYAIDNGYISRVRLSSKGYGKALYITLQDGHTAVYAHLEHFTPTLDSLVRAAQLAQGSYPLQLYFEADEWPVTQGEMIGTTGDTGTIGGPHLHFEIRAPNGAPVNPQQWYQVYDTICPRPSRLAVIPLSRNAVVENSASTQVYPLQAIGNDKYLLADTVTEWDACGLAVEIPDYLNDQPFRYGVYEIEYSLDNKTQYIVRYDQYFFAEDPQIFTERDYALFRTDGGKFHLLFHELSHPAVSFIVKNELPIQPLSPGYHPFHIRARDFNNNAVAISGVLYAPQDPLLLRDLHPVEEVNAFPPTIPNTELSIRHGYNGVAIEMNEVRITGLPAELDIGPKTLPLFRVDTTLLTTPLMDPLQLDGISSLDLYYTNAPNMRKSWPVTTMAVVPESNFMFKTLDDIVVTGPQNCFNDTALVWIRPTIVPKPEIGRSVGTALEVGPMLIPYNQPLTLQIPVPPALPPHTGLFAYNPFSDTWSFLESDLDIQRKVWKVKLTEGAHIAMVQETEPPEILDMKPPWGGSLMSAEVTEISFTVTDVFTGFDGENDIQIILDDHPLLVEYNSFHQHCRALIDEPLSVGPHSILILAEDNLGNQNLLKNNIIVTE